MARITVEDCLEKIDNRFELIIMASQRVKQLLQGQARPQVECDNKEIVTALREIAEGVVKKRVPSPEAPGEGGTI
ncbi:MAG: DNA-directed RNA polymerase subunit omega [Nitrospirae bacterium]|nr:DNA-directed RNA polymerase subunit omega [Nitrospirota bacterium]